jgi:hypothetical protein
MIIASNKRQSETTKRCTYPIKPVKLAETEKSQAIWLSFHFIDRSINIEIHDNHQPNQQKPAATAGKFIKVKPIF